MYSLACGEITIEVEGQLTFGETKLIHDWMLATLRKIAKRDGCDLDLEVHLASEPQALPYESLSPPSPDVEAKLAAAAEDDDTPF